jgi:hypothetical protein
VDCVFCYKSRAVSYTDIEGYELESLVDAKIVSDSILTIVETILTSIETLFTE